MKMMKPIPKRQEQKEEEEEENDDDQKGEKKMMINMAIWDCGSPLYDSYELVSLSNLIERHLMILPSLAAGSSKRFIMATKRLSHHHQPIHVDRPMVADDTSNSMMTRLSELVERKMVWKRKVFGSERSKAKNTKKVKATTTSTSFSKNISGLYNRIASWRRR
ncbi:hypothetical protein F8388_003911 [Cannabis sativa]|uniref:Uncharacterized protein n=2 Tax=Cannabis sativa TaxID=3483 RepID=A0A7J6I0H5_CANSA|nr:hypothetical protein F8388_003911 [Cannabis sativa]KAF4401047.1 hypothetical protein G4B88_013888 [Cannabis sativa]